MQSVTEVSYGHLITIDGKRLFGYSNRDDRRSAIHMVNVFATENNVVLGLIKIQNSSNGIAATPALLDLVDIQGCLTFIDAMGCQTTIAERVLEDSGDYLLALKGIYKELHNAVRDKL